MEASVRVLPSVDPAVGAVMLMRLMSPLLHVLAQGLHSPTPDETEVRPRNCAWLLPESLECVAASQLDAGLFGAPDCRIMRSISSLL